MRYRQTSFYLYFDDVWKITPHVTLSLGLRYENTPPWTDQSGNLVGVFFNAYDTTPNVTDQSRYPGFCAREGRGDPTESARPLAEHPARAGRRVGRQPVLGTTMTFTAHRHCLGDSRWACAWAGAHNQDRAALGSC